MTDDAKWKRHQALTAARTEREVLTRVAKFRALTSKELKAKLAAGKPNRPTPWEREALRRVLRERGEE